MSARRAKRVRLSSNPKYKLWPLSEIAKAQDVMYSFDSDDTKNLLVPRNHPPRDSRNRLCSNPASTPSADVGPFSSTSKASAAWRIAREARSRTAGATSGPETSARRVAIASEARDRTSARSRSLRNDFARFNPATNSGSSRNHSAAVSGSLSATSAPSDSVPART